MVYIYIYIYISCLSSSFSFSSPPFSPPSSYPPLLSALSPHPLPQLFITPTLPNISPFFDLLIRRPRRSFSVPLLLLLLRTPLPFRPRCPPPPPPPPPPPLNTSVFSVLIIKGPPLSHLLPLSSSHSTLSLLWGRNARDRGRQGETAPVGVSRHLVCGSAAASSQSEPSDQRTRGAERQGQGGTERGRGREGEGKRGGGEKGDR